MTEEPIQTVAIAPEPIVEPPPAPPRSLGFAPLVYAVGFVVLAGAIAYVWRYPSIPASTQVDLQPVEQRMAAIEARLSKVEQVRVTGGSVDLTPLTSRLDNLERRPVPDVSSLQGRVAALEQRPDSASNLAHDLDALTSRVATAEEAANKAAARADRLARVQAASAALAAGQKLGDIPGAPPALTRFAAINPPTEASLRAAFPAAEQAVLIAGRPSRDETTMVQRVLAQAEQLVIVRQGERVLIGDASAGVLEKARAELDGGDLKGAVTTLGELKGAPADAMAGWRAQATALLDARAALADLNAQP